MTEDSILTAYEVALARAGATLAQIEKLAEIANETLVQARQELAACTDDAEEASKLAVLVGLLAAQAEGLREEIENVRPKVTRALAVSVVNRRAETIA